MQAVVTGVVVEVWACGRQTTGASALGMLVGGKHDQIIRIHHGSLPHLCMGHRIVFEIYLVPSSEFTIVFYHAYAWGTAVSTPACNTIVYRARLQRIRHKQTQADTLGSTIRVAQGLTCVFYTNKGVLLCTMGGKTQMQVHCANKGLLLSTTPTPARPQTRLTPTPARPQTRLTPTPACHAHSDEQLNVHWAVLLCATTRVVTTINSITKYQI